MLELATVQLWLYPAALLAMIAMIVRRRHELDDIPTVGHRHPLLSWITGVKYLFAAKDLIQEGYARYPGGIFKIPLLENWVIIVNGTAQVEDMRKASNEELSSAALLARYLQYEYILGKEFVDKPYHYGVVRGILTRNVGERYQEIRDVVERVYSKGIPACHDEWLSVPALQLQLDTISKIASRFSVGYPLCENEELCRMLENAAIEIFKGRVVSLFPTFLKPLAARYLTGVPELRRRIKAHIEPIIKYRKEQELLHGRAWAEGMQGDLLSWLMDAAHEAGESCSVDDLSSRLLFVSFGAIHTSSSTFTAALYQLCLQQDDIMPLREEIQSAIDEEGWTKDAFGRMQLLDSFLRESQRVHPNSLLSAGRIALKDFTFSDGTFIPKGQTVSINSYCMHYDDELYPDASTFKASRFVSEDSDTQKLAVTPGLDYHPFGIGRAACPGRFFAIAQIKIMLAYLILNYDVKLPDDNYPSKFRFEANALPNRSAKVLFRKRKG